MAYVNTIITDFGNIPPAPVKREPVKKQFIKPRVFQKPKYSIDEVSKKLFSLLEQRRKLILKLNENKNSIRLLQDYLEAVGNG
jgi:hypothetical protein